jgi:hypothetical protein
VASVTEEMAASLAHASGTRDRQGQEELRQALWSEVRAQRLTAAEAITAAGAQPHVIDFLRSFDLSYRLRRLRLLSRRLGEIEERSSEPVPGIAEARLIVFGLIARCRAAAIRGAEPDPFDSAASAMERLGQRLDLRALDLEADARIVDALGALPRVERRALILSYLGFPFYDIATLPLLGGEGLEEFDPVKVDRISPDDACAIRSGGAAATLKGIQFNSFGAFFSRAYRENDYLWGRLHGADRLIDIVLSTLPEPPAAEEIASLKRAAFRAILEEERGRLGQIGPLIDELEREIEAPS